MLRGSLKKNHNQVATLKDDMSPKEGSNSSDIPSANCNQTLGNPLPSPSSSTITTTATATTMTSLSIVRPITIEPISTATTTTTTITTESTHTSVSTDGNLIGKMINDVSTTTMIYRPIAVGALHSIAKVPAAANHEIVGDFPSNDEQNDSSDTLTTDASNMTNTITLLESAAEELTSTASKLTTISTATTELDAVKYATHGRQRMAIIISEMKSESTENKCKPEELATVSRQRELEANSTKATSTATTTGALANLNWNKIDVRNLDITREPHKGLAPIKDKQLTFAARNAKLKLAFFKYPYHLENRHKLSALTKVPKKTEALIQAAKVINNPELNHFSCAQPNLILGRSLSRRATNLKLRIPEQLIKPSTRAVLESTKLSLVAQRKADLSRRFEEQSAIKTSTCQSKKSTFPSVTQLKLKYDRFTRKPQTQQRINSMIVNPNKLSDIASPETLLLKPIETMEQRHSPLSDEGCNLGQSPYSSDDNEDNVSIRTTSTILERKRKDKVARSASSDSALGLEVDDPMPEVAAIPPPPQQQQQRRMTLTVTDLPLRSALLPLAEPTALPDSPSTDSQATSQSLLSQSVVPSKVLLEERVVEIPEDPRYIGCNSLSSSRRESAQSCISDYPNSECSGVRFVRTPSVVVSDYSDDVMCGITLEEIEYFRAQRMRRRRSSLDTSGTEKDADGSHSDVSASSSCSNLYYCGSTISALDGAECYVNGIRMPLPERKASDCSTCSASGEEEDAFTIPEQPEDTTGQMGKDLADLLAAQHLSTKRPKKVAVANGLLYAVSGSGRKTVERYDTVTNTWTFMCSLREEPIDTPLCTIFRDKVIVCYDDCVDEYNSTINEWEVNSTLKGLENIFCAFSYSDTLLRTKFAEN